MKEPFAGAARDLVPGVIVLLRALFLATASGLVSEVRAVTVTTLGSSNADFQLRPQ